MSLKGLSKTPSPAPPPSQADDADAFIGAAKVKHNGSDKAQARTLRYKRVNLSLDEQVDAELDRLSLLPRDFKASRSDVVKAAVAVLAEKSESEIIEYLRNLRK